MGLPLAVAFGNIRETIGYDIDVDRIHELKNYLDLTNECTTEQLRNSKNLSFTEDSSTICDASIFIVTVPTPINDDNTPNLEPLKSASKIVGSVLKVGDIVIFESTVYPGATEEVCVPILQETSGLLFNEQFFCGYSPERVNPGDKVYTLSKIIKF